MARENLARLVRDRARRIALDSARRREADGDPEGPDIIRDLAAEIAEIQIGEE